MNLIPILPDAQTIYRRLFRLCGTCPKRQCGRPGSWQSERRDLTPDALARQLLAFEARGDRSGAETWMKRYDVMPADLQASLRATSDIPVDVDPIFSFPENVR